MKTITLNINDKVFLLLKSIVKERSSDNPGNYILYRFVKRIIDCIDDGVKEYDIEFKFQKEYK